MNDAPTSLTILFDNFVSNVSVSSSVSWQFRGAFIF